jgi:hypothetical protein
MKYKECISVICFYEASIGGHGAAEVTMSLYECLNIKKFFFEIKKKNIFKFLENYKLKLPEHIYKLFYVFILAFNFISKTRKYEKITVIIEGASWIGYSYLTIKIIKFFNKNVKIIYHSHNIEYILRKKKNNFIISFLSKIIEKKLYNLCDFGTAVSKDDSIKLKKLYNVKSIIFENSINKKRLKIKKFLKTCPKNFIIYPGSYSYKPNKLAIDLLVNIIFPNILKKYQNIKLVLTGSGFPVDIFKQCSFINYYPNLKKNELNFLINKSMFLLIPITQGFGTKLKIIESLMLGALIISSKKGMIGIRRNKTKVPFIFSNYKEMYGQIDLAIKKNFEYKVLSHSNINFYKKNYLMENQLKKFFKKIN